MRILSIETSCDETAISLLDISGKPENPEIEIIANALLSQVSLHEQYGGVYPNLAKREHQKNLPILLEKVLEEAQSKNTKADSIDFIAVTAGPGLEPALWTGIAFAEELGEKWDKPVIPVNHMEGHIFSVLYGADPDEKLELPALALLVSGGHTELVKVKDFGRYEIIGRTRDDAVGEAFDKVARILGLSYPGGPKISKLANEARKENIEPGFEFPRPMLHSKDLDFSYSGLKTAVLYKVRNEDDGSENFKKRMARAFEDASVEVLVAKTRKALEDRSGGVKTLIVAGGVSSNSYLREELEKMISEFPGVNLKFPAPGLSTDNAIMIGLAAYANASGNPEAFASSHIEAKGNLSLT